MKSSFVMMPALLSLCTVAWGQTKPAEMIYLDVIPSDATSAGTTQPLAAKDFELFADGKPLKIAEVNRVDTHLNRTLVLVVDDLGLSLDGIRNVQRVLRRFVAEQVQPGDRIAIERTSHTAAVQGFSADQTVLNAAVDRLEYHPLADSRGARPKTFTSGALIELRFVMEALAKTPGRKAVVLFSERVSLGPGAGAAAQQEAESSAARIAKLAGQGMVVFYCVVVRRPAVQADPSGTPRLETGLLAVTKESGGLWIDDTADLSAAWERILQDQAEYYRIGFKPEAHAYDYATGRDRYDKVAIRTIRSGVRLRTRTVVYGPVEADATPPFPPDVGDDDRESPLTSPFDDSGIGLQASAAFFYSASEGSSLEIVMHIDAKRLTYVRSLTGDYKCVVQVGSTAFDGEGQTVGETSRGVAYSLTEAQYQNVLANGVVYTQKLPIRKPGAYQVRSAVRDGATGRIGSAGHYLEIPDVKNGDLAMSGIANQPGIPAVRIFKPGSTFSYTYQLYNLFANGEKRSEAEIQSRLFRAGSEVFTGKPTTIAFDRSVNPNTPVVNGTISLGADMTPGRYILQVTATDKLADRPRTASQFIDLEVRP